MFEHSEIVVLADVMTTYYQSIKSTLDRNKSDVLLRQVYEKKLEEVKVILDHIYSKL